ncbi:hypothetical protein IV38_GL000430 [Lactobacillus selangorensis]|uniref:Uncharacterized protein n=1 Tax=Lactobacillus selangorensis TaxID=81857 RepID=A0A0R2FLQ5_9LACO|nr:hypothetical protein [Lactobacillus selangorensis]KRN29545.1 hypothetical protein IV38_GL000430 [Lactobacillus selangorensis]KRN33925.1 hypothetical protein IV40_GL000238 [Lactobacillus selangorensis]
MELKRTWRLLFYKPDFSLAQIEAFKERLQQQASFGGFPIEQFRIENDTKEVIFTSMTFDQLQAVTEPVLDEMAKFLLIQAVYPQRLAPQDYYAIIRQSDQQLGIERQLYPDQSMDVIYWHTLQLDA